MTFNEMKEIIYNSGLELRRYSGRGMYGKYCIAVEFNTNRDLAYLIESCEDTQQAAEMFREMKQDNMGLGMIAYWPYIAWDDSVADPDMNDDDNED